MHDSSTVAFEIKYPWKLRPSALFPEGYRQSIITIWHVDPESDGTDDSCGLFRRARHGDPAILKEIECDFRFNWDGDYGAWFNPNGTPYLSPIGITLCMFRSAAWIHFKRNRRKVDRFLRLRLYDIISFAENNVDSMHSSITNCCADAPREDRISSAASVIYGCILRWSLPWYKDARFHIHHWKLQIHPWQQFKRRFWDRCSKCGKRGFPPGVSAIGDWDGNKLWHSTCDADSVVAKNK